MELEVPLRETQDRRLVNVAMDAEWERAANAVAAGIQW